MYIVDVDIYITISKVIEMNYDKHFYINCDRIHVYSLIVIFIIFYDLFETLIVAVGTIMYFGKINHVVVVDIYVQFCCYCCAKDDLKICVVVIVLLDI